MSGLLRSLRQWWQVIRLLPRVGPGLAAAVLALAIVQSLLGLGFMLATGYLVGQIPAAIRGDTLSATIALVVLGVAYLAQQLIGAGHGLAAAALGRRFNTYLEDRAMAVLLAPPGIAHLEDTKVRDLAAEASNGLGAGRWRPNEAPAAFSALLSGGLMLLVSVGVVVWSAWWLGLLLGVAVVWAFRELDQHLMRMTLDQLDERTAGDYRRSEYEYEFAVAPGSAKEVRLFGFAPWILDRAQRRMLGALGLSLRSMARTTPAEVVALTGLVLVVAGGFGWTAWQAWQGGLGVAAAAVLAQALVTPISQELTVGQALLDIRMSMRPVTALRSLEARLPGDVVAAPRTELSVGPGRIRFENVWFRYPGTDVHVLRGVDLEFPVGGSLALVGLNGAGKTTIVKLLCRFYEPTAGRITLDGHDIAGFDPAAWQRRVAAIFQDFARLPMTARDNLRAGLLSADERVLASAASRAGAADVLEALPNGWETPLTKEVSEGTDLSGGQWQRVALARALVAASGNVAALVLDEPAANLDVRAEAELNRRFLDLAAGATTLVISHRFSTVRQADQIAVLDGGRITETGSHEELLAAGGSYAGLFRLQAARFA